MNIEVLDFNVCHLKLLQDSGKVMGGKGWYMLLEMVDHIERIRST
jgi:hypothetical protein